MISSYQKYENDQACPTTTHTFAEVETPKLTFERWSRHLWTEVFHNFESITQIYHMFLISCPCPHHILFMLRPCPIFVRFGAIKEFLSDSCPIYSVFPQFCQDLTNPCPKPPNLPHIFIYLIRTETIGVNWPEIMVYISRKIAIIHDWSWSFVILLIDANVWPPIKVESSSLNHITWRYINCNFQPF